MLLYYSYTALSAFDVAKESTKVSETTGASAMQDDMVSLPIPRRFYPPVLQFIGELYSREASGQPKPQPTQAASDTDRNRPWTREEVRRLKSIADNPTIQAVFELAKEQNGALVSIRDLEKHTGRKFGQVRADLAGLTRKCRSRLSHDNWPFEAVWAANGKAEMSYRVPDNILQWWYAE